MNLESVPFKVTDTVSTQQMNPNAVEALKLSEAAEEGKVLEVFIFPRESQINNYQKAINSILSTLQFIN